MGKIEHPVAMVTPMAYEVDQQLLEHYGNPDWWEVSAISRWALAMYQRYGKGAVFCTDPERSPAWYITDESHTPPNDLIEQYDPTREFVLLRLNDGVDFEAAKNDPVLAEQSYTMAIFKFSIADATPFLVLVPIEDACHPCLHICQGHPLTE